MSSKFIKVQSATEGFRRGGRAFGREPVTIDTSELSEAQLEAIRREPMLVVVDCEDPSAGDKASGSKGAAGKAAKDAADKAAAEKAAADKAAADKAAADKAAADKAAADKAKGNA